RQGLRESLGVPRILKEHHEVIREAHEVRFATAPGFDHPVELWRHAWWRRIGTDRGCSHPGAAIAVVTVPGSLVACTVR
ncbi:MAG: hypothetical protein M0Z53_09730, partial [Thermaerobacter sp.]|nr:hypothetical protein [Thermaerobacter sp.]